MSRIEPVDKAAKHPTLWYNSQKRGTVCNIVALCAAYREKGAALQVEDLSAHQVKYMEPNNLHLTTMPSFYGVIFQCIVVFMIPLQTGS